MTKMKLAATALAFPLLLAVAAGAASIRPPKVEGPTTARRVVLPERSAVSPKLSELPATRLYPADELIDMLNDLDDESPQRRNRERDRAGPADRQGADAVRDRRGEDRTPPGTAKMRRDPARQLLGAAPVDQQR